jgi:hypothetical protein
MKMTKPMTKQEFIEWRHKHRIKVGIISACCGVLCGGVGAGIACAITLKKTANIVDEQYSLQELLN